MPKIRRLQTSLIAGELDIALSVRDDLEQYYDGAELLRNVIPLTQGGVTRRPGLKYVAAVNSNAVTRQVEFQFSDSQRYLFVFTNARLDIYSVPDDTLVQTITTSPISSVTLAMLPDLNWTQSADTLILFHPDLATIKITRTGATTFTASSVTYTNIPAHAFGAVTVTNPAQTLTPSDVSGVITLTAGGGTVFSNSTDGQFVKINDGLVYLTGHSSGTVATGYVRTELRNTTAAAAGDWTLETGYEPVFSVSRGYARSGTFHEGRLYLGGLKSRPQTILGSKTGDYFNFDEGSLRATDAINATIDSEQLNAIAGIKSGRTLQIFTSGGEFSVPKSSQLDPITPTNISFLQQTNHGSLNIRPVSVDGATIFYDRKDLREFIYNDVEQSYIAPSLNLLSTHIISDVVDIDLRRSTSASNASYVFVVNGDGTISVLNTLRSQNITAWVKWTTNGVVEDICVVGDDVYFTIKRNINGSDVRYIEKLDDDLKLDCAVKLTSVSETDEWSGLDHLDGETVQAFGDNFVLPDVDIDSGETVTEGEFTEAEFGFEYFSRVKLMPFAGVFFGEDITGKMKRLVAVMLRVADTRNMLVNGIRPPLVQMQDAMDQSPPLISDFVRVPLGGYDRFAQVDITQDEPTEFTLYGAVTEVGIGS